MSGENKFHLILQMKEDFGYVLGFNCLMKEYGGFTRKTKQGPVVVTHSRGYWKSIEQYNYELYDKKFFNFRIILKYKGEQNDTTTRNETT